jgi:hypothetical protein
MYSYDSNQTIHFKMCYTISSGEKGIIELPNIIIQSINIIPMSIKEESQTSFETQLKIEESQIEETK